MTRFTEVLLAALLIGLLAGCSPPTENTGLLIDSDLCIGCGDCEKVCPYNAIEVIDGEAVINPSLCRLCYRCVEVCPKGAIF